MKTRTGKIAQLPKLIRDELNQRLQNGKQGPELLKWLNALPETQALLAEKCDAVPLSKQNLSEWRQGGYEEWLRHQQHDLRIRRIAEHAGSLKRFEDCRDDDLFEDSGRIALAELMVDMDSLHELNGEERSQRLHTLILDLARLQNAFNRSRWAALAYSKWNDRFLGPEDYEEDEEQTLNPTLTPAPTPISDLRSPIKTPAVKPSHTTSTGGDSLGAPASRPAQPLPSPRSDSVALPVPAESAMSPIGPLSPIPKPKTPGEIVQQNILTDFLR